MIKVYIRKQGNFSVSSPKIKKTLSKFLLDQGITSVADVDILIVGRSQMERIGKKYLSPKEPIHNVLTFATSESKEIFIDPPDNILHLGNIVVCYPVAVEEASKEGVLIEEKVIELIKHGAYHLLGKHHN